MTDQQSYILGIISELDNISEEYYINIYPYPLTLANIMNGSSSFGEGVEKLAAFNRFAHYYQKDIIPDLNYLVRNKYLREERHGKNIRYLITSKGLDFIEDNQEYVYEDSNNYDEDDEYADLREVINNCMCNRENAEEFDLDDLSDMCDWDEVVDNKEVIGEIKFNNGSSVPIMSKEEKKVIQKLLDAKYCIDIKGQNFVINYKLPNSKKERSYHPDLVILTYDYKIAIIEVKQAINFSRYTNQIKYNALKEYCEDNGYMYCMIDGNLTTYEDINDYDVSRYDEKIFVNYINALDADFTNKNVQYLMKYFNKSKEETNNIINALIIKYGIRNNSKYDYLFDCSDITLTLGNRLNDYNSNVDEEYEDYDFEAFEHEDYIEDLDEDNLYVNKLEELIYNDVTNVVGKRVSDVNYGNGTIISYLLRKDDYGDDELVITIKFDKESANRLFKDIYFATGKIDLYN